MTNSSSSTSPSDWIHDHHLTDTDLLAISIVAIVLGAVICFFGKKIFKIFLFVVGFGAVAAITYYVLLQVEHNNKLSLTRVEQIAIPIAAGFVGGCIVLGVVKLGFFLVGAMVGTVLSFMIFAVVGNHFGTHAFIIRLCILGVLALFCGAVVVWQEKKLIIIMSAIGGSYSVFAGADHWVKSGYVSAILGVFNNDALPRGNDLKLYIMLGGTILVALMGLLFQLVTDKKKKRKAGWESDPLIGRVNY